MADRIGLKTTEVMNAIRAKIANRAFAVGDRLPSIRGLAASMGVSPSTVVEAYDRLAADGLVRAHRGSGFYICAPTPSLRMLVEDDQRDPSVDPFWVSRQSLDADPQALKPGCGWLPADWMPVDALRRAHRSVARSTDILLTDYGSTKGSITLRRLLSARFSEEGIEANPDQILLTSSGTQSIDLICRLLLRPGNTVLVDDPCYFNFRALLKVHQANVVGIPYTQTGPDVEQFEAAVAAERPTLYITNSALHNPTGATISPATAHKILTIAAAHQLVIVEDDIFAHFEPDPSPRLAALDGLNRVIRIGSFSKTLSASVRCGYIAARRDWISELVDLQVATNFGGPSPVAADVIAHVLSSGGYRKHMDDVRLRLVRARREIAGRIESMGLQLWVMPRGGFFLWCSLPPTLTAVDLAQQALKSNIILAPGDVFSVSKTESPFIRFNVAQSNDARIWKAIENIIRAHNEA